MRFDCKTPSDYSRQPDIITVFELKKKKHVIVDISFSIISKEYVSRIQFYAVFYSKKKVRAKLTKILGLWRRKKKMNERNGKKQKEKLFSPDTSKKSKWEKKTSTLEKLSFLARECTFLRRVGYSAHYRETWDAKKSVVLHWINFSIGFQGFLRPLLSSISCSFQSVLCFELIAQKPLYLI